MQATWFKDLYKYALSRTSVVSIPRDEKFQSRDDKDWELRAGVSEVRQMWFLSPVLLFASSDLRPAATACDCTGFVLRKAPQLREPRGLPPDQQSACQGLCPTLMIHCPPGEWCLLVIHTRPVAACLSSIFTSLSLSFPNCRMVEMRVPTLQSS